FDGMFGTGTGQVPPASSVQSASLTITIFNNTSGAAGELHEAAAAWDEATVTWNNYGGEPGVQPDEIGALVAPLPFSGVASMDVTSSLQAWIASPPLNLGWILVPAS